MAGAGFKTFTAGEVLTASDVNTYLQEQTVMNFAGTAARASALPSPSEGMVSHIGGGTVEVYDGSTWVDIAPAIAPMGLVAVAPTSIANSGGSASLSDYTVSFSGVSSVSLNGCFTADYDNYRIVVAASQATSNTFMVTRLRASGTDNTSAVYAWQRHVVSASGAAVISNATTATSWNAGSIGTDVSGVVIDLQYPQTNTRTAGQVAYSGSISATIPEMGVFGLFHDANYQADGFTLSSTYAITGTVAVYGYKK